MSFTSNSGSAPRSPPVSRQHRRQERGCWNSRISITGRGCGYEGLVDLKACCSLLVGTLLTFFLRQSFQIGLNMRCRRSSPCCGVARTGNITFDMNAVGLELPCSSAVFPGHRAKHRRMAHGAFTKRPPGKELQHKILSPVSGGQSQARLAARALRLVSFTFLLFSRVICCASYSSFVARATRPRSLLPISETPTFAGISGCTDHQGTYSVSTSAPQGSREAGNHLHTNNASGPPPLRPTPTKQVNFDLEEPTTAMPTPSCKERPIVPGRC